MTRASAALRRLAWLLIGVLIGLALLLAIPERKPPAPADSRAADARIAAAAPDRTTNAGIADATTTRGPHAAATVSAGESAIQRGGDLHALAQALLPQAEAGDAEAQYSLALITRGCASELKRFADRAELEAFLETVPYRSGIDPVEYAAFQRSDFAACDGFRDDPLERFAVEPDWLSRAAASGHPIAGLERALRAPDEAGERDPDALRAPARAALASGRPEAFLLLMELEFPAEAGPESRDATPNAVAWWLLACQRGYPCDADARWRREQRAFRGGPGAEMDWEDALLFDLPAHEREQARERAAALGAALDAGDIDAALPLLVR